MADTVRKIAFELTATDNASGAVAAAGARIKRSIADVGEVPVNGNPFGRFARQAEEADRAVAAAVRQRRQGFGSFAADDRSPLRTVNRTAEEQAVRDSMAARIKAMRSAAFDERVEAAAEARLFGATVAKERAKAVESESAKMGGLRGLKEAFGEERLAASIFRGGLVGFAGEQLAGMTEKLVEMQKAAHAGGEDWASMSQKIMESLPIIGGFAKAGANIREMFTGEREELERLNTATENQNKLISVQRKMTEEARKYRRNADNSERYIRNETALLGVESPSREFIAAQQERDEALKKLDDEAEQFRRDNKVGELPALIPTLQEELARAQRVYGRQADKVNLPRLQEQRPDLPIEKLAPSLKPYLDEVNAAQAKLNQAQGTLDKANDLPNSQAGQRQAIEDRFGSKTALDRQRWNRQMEDEATAHKRRILGIEVDGEAKLSQMHHDAEQTRLQMVGRTYDAELQAIDEGTKQKIAALDKEEREAIAIRDNAEEAARRAADKTAIGYNPETERIAAERAERARKEFAAEDSQRDAERRATQGGGDAARDAAERRAKIDAAKSLLDFETQSLEQTTIAGQREAERLKIKQRYLETEKQLREQEGNTSLPQELRDQIKAARANLPEQEKLDLIEAARRNRGTLEVYAQAQSGRGFTGQSESRAAELRKVDEAAETQKRMEKLAQEQKTIAERAATALEQLYTLLSQGGGSI